MQMLGPGLGHTEHPGVSPMTDHKRSGLEHLLQKERLRELELFHLKKRCLRRILQMFINTQQKRIKENRVRLFPVIPSE